MKEFDYIIAGSYSIKLQYPEYRETNNMDVLVREQGHKRTESTNFLVRPKVFEYFEARKSKSFPKFLEITKCLSLKAYALIKFPLLMSSETKNKHLKDLKWFKDRDIHFDKDFLNYILDVKDSSTKIDEFSQNYLK